MGESNKNEGKGEGSNKGFTVRGITEKRRLL